MNKDNENNEYHTPVLLDKVIELLVTKSDGIYVDGTIGGGGHSSKILESLSSKGKLFGFDKDIEAINFCRKRFKAELEKGEHSRLELFNTCFSSACSITRLRGEWTGFLLDLGVSSRQLESSYRGFSYRATGPLDLRFAPVGPSAKELVNAAREDELAALLHKYGEEPFAKRIAREIVLQRRLTPVSTTSDLKNIIENVVPKHFLKKTLSRVFQALRIAINNELEILEKTLHSTLDCLAIGGRIVVISYHSLEDRIVKNFFLSYSAKKKEATNIMPKSPMLMIITKKPITPNLEEQKKNPRSRSAKLRAAEKIA
ncbi:MAG: 16S rRNA (cytosine(1402)-N(4))-methyltransferase RsmH [Candidatus Kapaibacteriales bacterium]